MTARFKTLYKKAFAFVARHTVVLCLIGVVILTVANKQLTLSIMVEILGYGMLMYLIASIGNYVYTPKNFTQTDAQGAYTVLGDNLKAAAFLVGLCVAGMYFAKTDGSNQVHTTLLQSIDSLSIERIFEPSRDTGTVR